jgi:hypothetical protein
MPDALAEYLQSTIDRELPQLRELTDEQAAVSLRGGWTRKEELGHLIDSATNNHARFVRMVLEDDYRGPSYDPDGWVGAHGYAHMLWETLTQFWYAYNSLLAELIRHIPEERLEAAGVVGDSTVTLGFLIEDYVVHLQHHVDQLLGREVITQYPQATSRISEPAATGEACSPDW